jgi:hypothetical protein
MHIHRLVKRNIQKRIDKNIILKCIYEICLFQLWTNNNNFNNFREGTASLASLVDTPHQTRTIELLIINAQVSMSEFYLENFFFFTVVVILMLKIYIYVISSFLSIL